MTPEAFTGSVSMLHTYNRERSARNPERLHISGKIQGQGTAVGKYTGYGFETVTSTKTIQNSTFSYR